MENIKSFISKKIITLQGENLGYVLDGLFDRNIRNFKGFIVVDNESEEEFLLKKEDIFSLGQDCIIIENSQVISPLIMRTETSFIGKDVYSTDGIFLGNIRDIFIEKNQVKKVICTRAEILPKNIIIGGDGCVIVGNKKKRRKSIAFPRLQNDKRLAQITQIESSEGIKLQAPAKFIGNLNFVLNKIMQYDLMGLNNEIIAKKGEKINKNIINKAISHGKANLLLFYCK